MARVYYRDGEVCRALSAMAWEDWKVLAGTRFLREGMAAGRIVGTREDPGARPPGEWAAALAHERVPFVSYPYEWPFGMLRDAALLTLRLQREALAEGFTLKDATPYNVQWFGARPCLVDVTSFVPYAGGPWVGYRQFCQLFLFPLLLQARRGVPFQPWLRGSLDGIAPGDVSKILSSWDAVRTGTVPDVMIQARLDRAALGSRSEVVASLNDAGFGREVLEANVDRLLRVVGRLEWEPPASPWTGYAEAAPYAEEDRERKRAFVARAAAARPGGLVWDLGCHVGEYSRLAAEHADTVVAMDGDAPAVERLYREQRLRGETRILPLVADVADPPPAQGWRGRERKSLPERGRPRLTLCLALIHHLVLGRNLPLADMLDWLGDLGTDLVIEFVGPEDPNARQLLENRTGPPPDYGRESFERYLEARFEVLEREELSGGDRILYFATSQEEPR